MIRVAIVDDHPVVRLGLRVALEGSDRIALVGEGSSLADARDVVRDAAPDVLLLDLRLPDGRAIDEIEALRALRPGMHVVVLTGQGTAEDAHAALAGGASGYLLKDDVVETLVDSLTEIVAGKVVVAPMVRAELAELDDASVLTKREREVLALVVEGCTNPEIGRILGISAGTVRTHVSKILEKLGVTDRTEATSVALRRGLV
ncbi:MAG: response regulator transcription factor [Myxococcales bacterium]|jgi:DNA-binding NarL/FixJ family response regulator|nr:response regulator transcription factor [Myxococcales bacterium]